MRLKLELQAHSRLLSSMAIHPSRDIFVTAAEDATCNVWTLPLTGSDQVRIQAAHSWLSNVLQPSLRHAAFADVCASFGLLEQHGNHRCGVHR